MCDSHNRYYNALSCRLWFLRPLYDLATLKNRQDAVEFLMSPHNEEILVTFQDCIKHIRNISVRLIIVIYHV